MAKKPVKKKTVSKKKQAEQEAMLKKKHSKFIGPAIFKFPSEDIIQVDVVSSHSFKRLSTENEQQFMARAVKEIYSTFRAKKERFKNGAVLEGYKVK